MSDRTLDPDDFLMMEDTLCSTIVSCPIFVKTKKYKTFYAGSGPRSGSSGKVSVTQQSKMDPTFSKISLTQHNKIEQTKNKIKHIQHKMDTTNSKISHIQHKMYSFNSKIHNKTSLILTSCFSLLTIQTSLMNQTISTNQMITKQKM